MGWLGSWSYRKKITITNSSSSDVTDYQVDIVLDSSNFDFSKANSDGSDIRFTSDDGQTPLSYWIESWDSANSKAKVWVKVPSIPANSSVDIYMYYGKPSATDESNMADVFIAGCNFDDGTLCGFEDISQSGSYVTVSSDYSISPPNSLIGNSVATNTRAIAKRPFSVSGDFRYSYWFRPGTNTYIVIKDSADNTLIQGVQAIDGYLKYRDGGTLKSIQTISWYTWYKIEIRAYTSTHKFDVYVNDELKVSGASWTNTGTPAYFQMNVGDTSHYGTSYLDNFFVAKYNSDISYSIGSEEVPSEPFEPSMKVWDGTAWKDIQRVYYWNGTSWCIPKNIFYWDGSQWVPFWTPPYEVIWHCDYDAHKVYELSTSDLSVVRSASSPDSLPWGIGGDTDTIWLCDSDADKVYELSTTDLSVIRSASSPSTSPSGIGGDANVIWHCDNNFDRVYELSTTDFSVVRSASSPTSSPMGIGGDVDVIWHCELVTVYELSTTDFSVVRSASPTSVPRGIGGDTDTIWYSDAGADKVYELSTVDFGIMRSTSSPSTNPVGIGGK